MECTSFDRLTTEPMWNSYLLSAPMTNPSVSPFLIVVPSGTSSLLYIMKKLSCKAKHSKSTNYYEKDSTVISSFLRVLNIYRRICLAGLELEIQRGTAIIKRGSLRKSVKDLAHLGLGGKGHTSHDWLPTHVQNH